MKAKRYIIATVMLVSSAVSAVSAPVYITVTQPTAMARSGAVIEVPWSEVGPHLQGLVFDQIVVRDANGQVVPSQVTAFHHVHKGPPHYDQLIFQHDFSAGETIAKFSVDISAKPEPPLPSRVYARYVPERFDDFAWENDRVAHRAYGPALELPSATKDQMTSSGLDLWTKRVRYLVVDHWYHKGHDGLHTDTGEGLDMYDVGPYRGLGGTGVWDGQELHVSRNWNTWHIYANGPLRADFDLGYAPWDAGNVWNSGNGVMVSETKRVLVDAGSNFDTYESTFDFRPAKGADGELTIAIGVSKHTKTATVTPMQDENAHWLGVWEEYKNPVDGNLGTAVALDPSAHYAGIAETPHDRLLLVKVRPGETVRYYVGGGWDKSGDFADQAAWLAYVKNFVSEVNQPLKIVVSTQP
jgi:Domain of unknown function (DUF4861)